MLNTLNINLKTDIKTDRPTSLPITLMSQDKNNNQFILRFTNGGEAVALDDTYTVEVLTKFSKSGVSRLTSATVRQDYATWEFDTAYITQDETVYNYVYVRKSGSLVVSADANAFAFDVDLSEIDKNAGRVAEVYDENYQKYLDEFKDNVDFEEIAQAEQARKEAELFREENYEQKVDTAIVEADVVAKVDNKVTELTPRMNELTAQLAQTVRQGENEVITKNMLSREIKEDLNNGEIEFILNTSEIANGAITPSKVNEESYKYSNFEESALRYNGTYLIYNEYVKGGISGDTGGSMDDIPTKTIRLRGELLIYLKDDVHVKITNDRLRVNICKYYQDGSFAWDGWKTNDFTLAQTNDYAIKVVIAYKDDTEIPLSESENIVLVKGNAKELLGNSLGVAFSSDLDERYIMRDEWVTNNPQKLPRPDSGVVNFKVEINTDLGFLETENTSSLQDGVNVLEDDGILFLPENYERTGTPLQLVINCHGAGTTITPTSTMGIYPPYIDYLVNGLGYAVLDMNGIPKTLSGNTGLHFGSPIALQSYLKGYTYVTGNYNLKKEVFIIGTSMGGLTSNMLVQSGVIPVKAQGSFCGAVDHYKQAWYNPWNSGQREKIADLFNFTGQRPTFTPTGAPTQEEKDYYIQNLDKVIGYNPMMKNTYNWDNTNLENYGNEAEKTSYNNLVKYHPAPLKVWHNDDDGSVLPRYSEYFVKAIKNAGGLAYMRRFPSGGHNSWDNGDTVSAVDYKGNQISVKTSPYELGLWFKRFE